MTLARRCPDPQVMEEVAPQAGADSPTILLLPTRAACPRYDNRARLHGPGAATIGWASKLGGWSITDAGIEALEAYPDASELNAELERRYREVDQRRKQAMRALSDVQPVHR